MLFSVHAGGGTFEASRATQGASCAGDGENSQTDYSNGQKRRSADLGKASAANLRLLNPEFEYLFFDDAGVELFIDTEFPEYRAVFGAFPVRIQRYDFFRYLVVYRLGDSISIPTFC